ncbi:MAG: AAA family ATPase [Arcicella sp.]|nr:AAA family ATPase [Arcicella sp.]
MQIKSLSLFNFRIYKGANPIDLTTYGDKNIIVISGKNGFGKTTFLMSLVWCLYGKNMNEVDDFYDEQIKSQGGYAKYISNSLNRQAKLNGESQFYVSMNFSGLDIQSIPCKEITIRRTYDIQSSTPEKLEILFDGLPNELINEYGAEHFIRDFIIPLESAKFFFFDAEKIVSLAESNDIEQQKKLSKAYSEVLGIKKYEDLSANLNNLHLRYKQDSATLEDKKKLIELRGNEQKNEMEIEADRKKVVEVRESIDELKYEERQIQQKLIQESNIITSDELSALQNRSDVIHNEIEEQRKQLNELLEIAPFAIAGDNLMLISEQAEKEMEVNKKQFKDEEVDSKTEKVLYELDQQRVNSDVIIHTKTQEFYNQALRKLIRKHFFDLEEEMNNEAPKLHEFNEVELYELQSLIGNLKQSFRNQFKSVNQSYSSLLAERNAISKKITDAGSKEEDGLIKSLRDKQKEIQKKIDAADEEIIQLSIKTTTLENDQTQIKSQISSLAKKIDTSDLYKDKDELTKDLITELKVFINKYKDEKKKSLEDRILSSLNTLMHKKIVKKVNVEMIDEHINIQILNSKGIEIPKDSLSMGEKQLYATALLKALVEESNINFPVFVDSPMQKFDEDHSANVIQHFYPTISEQVVVFPILKKEMTEDEFKMMRKNVDATFCDS